MPDQGLRRVNRIFYDIPCRRRGRDGDSLSVMTWQLHQLRRENHWLRSGAGFEVEPPPLAHRIKPIPQVAITEAREPDASDGQQPISHLVDSKPQGGR